MPEPSEQASPARRIAEMIALLVLASAFLGVSSWRQKPFAEGVDNVKAIGIIVAAGLTLIMYSFLYRDNPLFKIGENLYVGVALGYLIIKTWQESLLPEIYDPLFNAPTTDAFYDAVLHRTVPIVLGVLLLTRISRKHGWLSRYSYALMIGWGAGVGIVIATHSWILKQVEAAIRPLQEFVTASKPLPEAFTADWFSGVALPIVGGVSILIGTVTVLFYFFFSIEHKRTGRAVSRVGIWFLMISFGASFGNTVMARLSLLIGRVRFLLFDWLKLPL